MTTRSKVDLALWESELSPFALKIRAMADYAGLDYRRLPAGGARLENLRTVLAIRRAVRSRTVIRHGGHDRLDDFPLVPYWIEGGRHIYYDSSALARHFDERYPAAAGPIVPADPVTAFAASWIDEAFDEIGLYLVHHRRWVLSASTNDAGQRLAREMSHLYPPGGPWVISRVFPRRQVRRLPYLFSVAPEGFHVELPSALVPPSRAGFPPTHELLDRIWESWIDAVEAILCERPYLLGSRFTLADASVYGQLAMNLVDPSAAEAMRDRAPTTYAWLHAISRKEHAVGADRAQAEGELDVAVDETVAPLLRAIGESFAPLMVRNAAAYERAVQDGVTRFNEAAFDRGEALYDGELLGTPFRSVVKTFQVRAWRDLRNAWAALDATERERLASSGITADVLE